ncbi:MAG: hypothetical protein E3J46_07580 [Desulfobacteraceae bacterium]|nr:MAG: hypothetical protein E3J46_07580 [Desulfobacteraceae bacterium]
MDKQIKNNLKKALQYAEVKVTRSILRWKYEKEGKVLPQDKVLENESRQVAARAHDVVAGRGKSILREIKKVYFKGPKKKEGSDE